MIHILAAGTSRTDAKGVGEADSIYDNLILDQWTIPFGSWIDQMVDWTDLNLDWLLDGIKWPFEMLIKYFITEFLVELPWMWVVLATVIIGSLVRSPKVGITAEYYEDVPGAIRNSLESSLKRLQQSHVDIFQLHNTIDDSSDREVLAIEQIFTDILPTFEKLRDESKGRLSGSKLRPTPICL